jgi:hypothetical protein
MLFRRGDHKPTGAIILAHTAVTSDVKIDSSATRQYGFNGASSSEVPVVEDKIFIAHGPANYIVLETQIVSKSNQPQHNNQTHQTYHHV